MGIKTFNPKTPGLRQVAIPDHAAVTKSTPEKSLVEGLRKTGGRNNTGKLSTRHRGGGNRRLYRKIDFKRRRKAGIPAKVVGIEYDPNRTCHIALIMYADGERAYILAPKDLKVGDAVQSGPGTEVRTGNMVPLKEIPLGTVVHNVELVPGKGGQMVRSAGVGAQIMALENGYAALKLPSGEMRRVLENCWATVGQVGHEEWRNVSLGKAGRKRWLGIRPTVRGTVMNPVDHPHGGGEGRNSNAGGHPVSPWGVPAKGGKTRKKKASDKHIIRRRKK